MALLREPGVPFFGLRGVAEDLPFFGHFPDARVAAGAAHDDEVGRDELVLRVDVALVFLHQRDDHRRPLGDFDAVLRVVEPLVIRVQLRELPQLRSRAEHVFQVRVS